MKYMFLDDEFLKRFPAQFVWIDVIVEADKHEHFFIVNHVENKLDVISIQNQRHEKYCSIPKRTNIIKKITKI